MGWALDHRARPRAASLHVKMLYVMRLYAHAAFIFNVLRMMHQPSAMSVVSVFWACILKRAEEYFAWHCRIIANREGRAAGGI